MKRISLLCIAVLIHLHLFAGGLIRINSFSPLKPVISVTLSHEAAIYMRGDLQNKGVEVLGLYMMIHDTPATVAVKGKYQLKGQELSFTPLYTLGNGIAFEVRYSGRGSILATKIFETEPGLPGPALKVEQVYPKADTVPVNVLYFHVRFNNRMRPDASAYKYVKVYDAAGVESTQAWRQRSFWLDSGRLLVLMVHPGRVKTGIDYGGPLFEQGQSYTISIGKDMQDVNGSALTEDYTRKYFIKGADKVSPKMCLDSTTLPHHGTLEPLILHFDEGMDHGSVVDAVRLADSKGKTIACAVVNDNDSSFRIVPAEKWNKKKYSLVLKPTVYDHAANRLYRLFEVSDVKEFEKDHTNIIVNFRAR